ncbi:hypothetical protein [Bailinhaonella thermotolerans]|uniref:Uncharacterized protein n=1 Tax=Bailinhaonella thermotolerans TaxID=1070861 RepID=A0A3A4BHQ3_9ACTN|nr:hypothetical protein [Bailinhaonella thermotolerans]RJL30792.1 hypothetical protein D5H75_20975 [Bailinhaonella thermotolerans]
MIGIPPHLRPLEELRAELSARHLIHAELDPAQRALTYRPAAAFPVDVYLDRTRFCWNFSRQSCPADDIPRAAVQIAAYFRSREHI